ncbi:MAG: translation initiation factor Sui1 [Myxococcales bacterium]|nr:translation initiation factor Sui1 [Myxococcales bacterium]
MSRDDARTVYSSQNSAQPGRICPDCRMPKQSCQCRRRKPDAATGDGVVRVRREVKGRRGKPVTTIAGVPLGEGELRDLASELKRRCGSGGSLKAGVIEIQGDHRDEVVPLLEARGFQVKRAGG